MSSPRSVAIAGLFLVTISTRAQGPAGEITGSVTDSTGALVSCATITITNPATNTQRTVKTNNDGLYDAPALPPDIYSLKVEMPGFGSQVRNDIELQVAQVARIDIGLKVGNVSEVVVVTGGALVLETESSSVGTVIENRHSGATAEREQLSAAGGPHPGRHNQQRGVRSGDFTPGRDARRNHRERGWPAHFL
jgi:hypothetical protein